MKRSRRARAAVQPEPQRSGAPSWGVRLIDAAAFATIILCALLAWASRGNLNVDGVSYLDLAARLGDGDWKSFVQGYWSPAYPVLLALSIVPAGLSGSAAVTVAHLLNFWVAVLAIVMLWLAARRRGDPALALLAFTAFLVCSARTPRLDAVTPDLLLLVAVTGLGLELLREEGWRGVRAGLWAGLAYLAKTSAWPWLLAVVVLGLVAAGRNPHSRRELGKAAAVALVPILCWAGLLAAESGWSTFADSGRYGECWYLRNCDGRSPDIHRGEHRSYLSWDVDSIAPVRVAMFPSGSWTYTPWSDPSAWQRGIITQRRDPIAVSGFIAYFLRQAGATFRYWLPWLIFLVLIPGRATTRALPALRESWRSPDSFLMMAGVLGVCQFLSVHAEPRLIAPFVLLAALGFIHRLGRGTGTRWQWPAALAGYVVALGVGVAHLSDQARVTRSSDRRTARLEATFPPGAAPHRIVIVGEAFGLVPDLYRARAMATAQVMELDGRVVPTLTSQLDLARRMGETGATAAWLSTSDSSYSIVLLPGAE
ncbi:MAG TPA: hypothetical protein PLL69_04755 [Gemmatimonadales bacterium]|nr:hypothetical protein [Gemmatimonadales bacterium]